MRGLNKKFKGNTLVEYSLIAGLVGVLSIAALGGLSAGLNMALNKYVQQNEFTPSSPSQSAANPPVTAGTPDQNRGIPQTTELSSFPGAKNLTLTLSNGEVVSVPHYASSLPELVETVGVNGATKQMLANLTQLTQSLLEAGLINQTEADNLNALANQGHRMAQVEKLLEDCGQTKCKSIVFDGKTYTPLDLGVLLGIKGGTMTVFENNPSLTPSQLAKGDNGDELKMFLSLYNQALQSSAMREPAVKSLVDNLVIQISYLTELSESYAVTNRMSEMNELAASRSTNLHSVNICTAGGSQSNGVECL